MRQVLAGMTAALALGGLTPAALAQGKAATDGAAQGAAMQAGEAATLNVKVNGMVCDFCAQAVEKVFSKEPGVTGVHVDLDAGEIHVGLSAGAALSEERVRALVKKSGYAFISMELAGA